ncbi:cytochrome P450 4c21-like [Thrips palmi]|uniref:Cytochrome P450 4c21-like n=1 Tax=Thrips palmi TaxID=161013 RepID=A0A6P8YJ54_THRPL|nr:cytochrome P450 4c21-like [Thrips palmi]
MPLQVLLLAVLGLIVVLLVRSLLGYLHFRRLELAIPGRPSLPLLGNALEAARTTPDTIMKTILWLVDGRREMRRASIFNHLIVSLQDPVEIEELVRRKDFNDKSAFIYDLIQHDFGAKGLIQLNGAEWKAHRKWLAPGFNQNVLNSFVNVFSEEAKGFVDRVEVGMVVDVLENLRKTAMRNFIRTSVAADGLHFDDELLDSVEFLELLCCSVNARSFNPLLWSYYIFALTPLGKKMHKMKSTFESLCRRIVAAKRMELKSRDHCDFKQARETLMDILVRGPEDGAGTQEAEQDIMDEFKTFLAANVETTVSALSWMLKVLSLKPEVQERVHAELVSVFGDSGRLVAVEDLPKLKYLDRVIKEIMRMFPPVPFTGRQCYEETKLCGHTIPAGSTIGINIFGAHRDPKHWDKPDEFDPDRFLPENCKDRHPCAYIPFSTGPRHCIGGKYAMMNMTTILATALRAFKVLPVDDHKDLQSLADNMTFGVSSHLVGGVRVKFEAREPRLRDVAQALV